MIRKILIISSLLLVMNASAQKPKTIAKAMYNCVYEFCVKTDKASELTSTVLQFNTNEARFMDYSVFELDSVKQEVNINDDDVKKFNDVIWQQDVFFDQVVYQNYPKGKISVFCPIGLVTCTYQQKDRIDWELLQNENKTVCGYTCSKARTTYAGRTWEVWYANEISVPFGPWKLTGLPGLILEARAKTETGELLFTATSFRKTETYITAPLPIKYKKATREQFIKHKNKFETKPMSNLPVAMLNQMTIYKKPDGSKQLLVNGTRIRLHLKVPYIPLELE